MNRTELINILNILKNDKSEQKGFSIRRTIKTLQYARKMQAAEEYRRQLFNAMGADKYDSGNE